MTLDQFIATNNGKSIDYDGVYGAQCVDLIKYYLRDCYGLSPGAWGNAKDYFYTPNPAILTKFTKITNNPSDLNQVPKRGDIIIWSGALAGSGGYGHIAIYDGRVSPGVFRSFDQNWGGAYCHFVTHNYTNVLGWLTPKVAPVPPQGDEMFKTDAEIQEFYYMLRGQNATAGEVAGWRGKSMLSFVLTAKPEVANREIAKRQAQEQITNLTNLNNQLNQAITDITANTTATKAEKDAALAKIADLQSELTTAMDKLKEAENMPSDEKAVVENWIIRTAKTLWNGLFNRKG